MEIAVANSSSMLELVRDMSPRIVSSHRRGVLMPLLARFEKNGGVNEGKMMLVVWLSLEAIKYHRRPLQEAFIARVRDLDDGA